MFLNCEKNVKNQKKPWNTVILGYKLHAGVPTFFDDFMNYIL